MFYVSVFDGRGDAETIRRRDERRAGKNVKRYVISWACQMTLLLEIALLAHISHARKVFVFSFHLPLSCHCPYPVVDERR